MSTLKIFRDEYPISPRENDNLGTMHCWHRGYNLGDDQPKKSPKECYNEHIDAGDFELPLFLLDHSGITMNTTGFRFCDPDGWDWGQVGFIFVSKEKVREYFGVKHISKKLREKVFDILRDEVKVYDQYLRGECWGFDYTVGVEGKIIREESVSGFFGDTLEETGIKESIPQEALPLLEKAWEDRK